MGRKTVIACAHSLHLVADESVKGTKSKAQFTYLEKYWIQNNFTKNMRGEIVNDTRVQILLYKYHIGNDWAVFIRADNDVFADSEIATIDRSLLTNPSDTFLHQRAAVLHCPVSLLSGITFANEFSVGCNKSAVHIQSESSHHLKYEGRDLVRGSSGGGLFLFPHTNLVGMHSEAINEADFDADTPLLHISHSDKRSGSEDLPYQSIECNADEERPKKKRVTVSETVASVAGGINGLGSALILCKYPRLIHYIDEIEKSDC